MVVIDAWSRYFVELLSRLVRQLAISFHTLLCMTLHVIRPWRNTSILGEWKFLCSPRGNSRFKHGSVIVHNIFLYFTLSLSAPRVYMIQERCWFSQIDFFVKYVPHRIKILFLSSQLDVIQVIIQWKFLNMYVIWIMPAELPTPSDKKTQGRHGLAPRHDSTNEIMLHRYDCACF